MKAWSCFNLTAVNGAPLSAWARRGPGGGQAGARWGPGEAVVSSGKSKLSSLQRALTSLPVLTAAPTCTCLYLLKVCFLEARGCSFGGLCAGCVCAWFGHFRTFGAVVSTQVNGAENSHKWLRWVCCTGQMCHTPVSVLRGRHPGQVESTLPPPLWSLTS